MVKATIEAPNTATPESRAKAGDVITFLTATTFVGDVWGRGAQLVLTPERIESSLNIHGVSWIDTDLSPDCIDPRIVLGAVEITSWIYGSTEWREAREVARQEAWKALTASQRAIARAEVERVYGPALDPTTGTGTRYNRDPQQPAGAAWT